MLPTKPSELIQALGLVPSPDGGYYQQSVRRIERYSDKTRVETHKETEQQKQKPKHHVVPFFWIPDQQAPIMNLTVAKSDHVLYFQGGKPFECWMYDPSFERMEHCVLGPDVCNGQRMQLVVRGGVWKCGSMIMETGHECEFSLLGDATTNDTDDDLSWISLDILESKCSIPIQEHFKRFLREIEPISSDEEGVNVNKLGNDTNDDENMLYLLSSHNSKRFQFNYEPV